MYEFDGNNVLTARHTHGPGVDDPLYTTTPVGSGPIGEISPDPAATENYYYHKDGINSVREITNEDGEVVHRTDFDTFGNILKINDCDYDSSTMSSSNVSIGDPFLTLSHDFFFTYSYTGRQWDKETDMFYYRARYYDAEIGRFISEDPQWSKNLYAYVDNNPVNYVDPSGKFIQFAFWVTFVFIPAAVWASLQGLATQFSNLNMEQITDLYLGILAIYEFGGNLGGWVRFSFMGQEDVYLGVIMGIGGMSRTEDGRDLLEKAHLEGWNGMIIGGYSANQGGTGAFAFVQCDKETGMICEGPIHFTYALTTNFSNKDQREYQAAFVTFHELYHFLTGDLLHEYIENNPEEWKRNFDEIR